MNLLEARKILGVDANASFDEVRRRFRILAKQYHPDIVGTGEEKTFVIISSAYLLLQSDQLGIKNEEIASEDINEAIRLKNNINSHLDTILEDYREFSDKIQASTKRYIEDAIYSAKSTDELKSLIGGRIAKHLVDVKTRLEHHLKHIERTVKSDTSNFLFKLFRDMYRESRRYWLYNFWKEPAFVGQGIIIGSIEVLKAIPDFALAFPNLIKIVSIWWLPLVVIGVGMSILLFKYILLNPSREFVPPKLSIESISKLVEEESARIRPSDKEIAGNSALAFGVIGTLIMPGVGTAIGAALGAIGGWLWGKDFGQIKQESKTNLLNQLNHAFEEMDDCIADWIKKTKMDLYRASIESFKKNCKK